MDGGTVLNGESTGFNIREAFDKAMPSLKEFSKPTPGTEPKVEAKPEPKAATTTVEPKVQESVKPTEEAAEVTAEPQEATNEPLEEVAEEPTQEPQSKEGKRWAELKKTEKEFKALQNTYKSLESDITRLREEKVQIEQKAAEADRIRQELDAAYSELQVTRIEAHPEFQKAVTQPRNAVFTELVQLAERTKIKTEDLIEAIHKDMMGDPDALTDFVETNGINDRWKSKIYQSAENLSQIGQRETDLRKNSKSALEALNKKQQEQLESRKQEITAERSRAAEHVSTKFTERMGALLPEGHGLDFKSIQTDAQNFDGLSETEKTYSAYAGYALPKVIESYEKEKADLGAKLKAANAELAKFRNGGPKTSAGTPATPQQQTQTEKAKPDPKKGWDSFAAESMSRLKQFARA